MCVQILNTKNKIAVLYLLGKVIFVKSNNRIEIQYPTSTIEFKHTKNRKEQIM